MDTVNTFDVGNVRLTAMYDTGSENPFEWGWPGLYFESKDSRRMDAGDATLAEQVEAWQTDYNMLECEVESAVSQWEELLERDEPRESNAWVGAVCDLMDTATELHEHLGNRPEIIMVEESDHTIYIDPTAFRDYSGYVGSDEEMTGSIIKGEYDTYCQWANGDVFSIMAEHLVWDNDLGEYVEGEEIDRISGVYTPSGLMTDDELLSSCNEHFGLGLKESE